MNPEQSNLIQSAWDIQMQTNDLLAGAITKVEKEVEKLRRYFVALCLIMAAANVLTFVLARL